MKRVLWGCFAGLIILTPALAQESDTRWIRKAVGRAQVCDWGGGCRWEYRYGWVRVPSYSHYWRAPVYTHPTRVYGYTGYYNEGQDKGQRCAMLPNGQPHRISAVGIEAFDKEKAKEQAVAAWAEIVRAKIGGRWMDVANAEASVFECWRSATGNRASEKMADFGGRELHQCSVDANPCRAKLEIADAEDPATEAAIRRLRALGYEVDLRTPTDPDAPKKPRILRRIFPKKE
jgi:hypothetical protein